MIALREVERKSEPNADCDSAFDVVEMYRSQVC